MCNIVEIPEANEIVYEIRTAFNFYCFPSQRNNFITKYLDQYRDYLDFHKVNIMEIDSNSKTIFYEIDSVNYISCDIIQFIELFFSIEKIREYNISMIINE